MWLFYSTKNSILYRWIECHIAQCTGRSKVSDRLQRSPRVLVASRAEIERGKRNCNANTSESVLELELIWWTRQAPKCVRSTRRLKTRLVSSTTLATAMALAPSSSTHQSNVLSRSTNFRLGQPQPTPKPAATLDLPALQSASRVLHDQLLKDAQAVPDLADMLSIREFS